MGPAPKIQLNMAVPVWSVQWNMGKMDGKVSKNQIQKENRIRKEIATVAEGTANQTEKAAREVREYAVHVDSVGRVPLLRRTLVLEAP